MALNVHHSANLYVPSGLSQPAPCVLAASRRLIDGKPYDPTRQRDASGTLIKVRAGNVACYVATHTDRRLSIADAGNARILSVKLGSDTTYAKALKDVPERGKGSGAGDRGAGTQEE